MAEYMPVMFMLPATHRDALQVAATKLRRARGGWGRANASEVLRAVLHTSAESMPRAFSSAWILSRPPCIVSASTSEL